MERSSSLLSGKEIVQHHRTCSKELPEIGVKLYEPSGSWIEANKLSYALDERCSLLKEPRIERDSLLSVAKWDEEKKRVVVLKKRGKEWETYGHHDSKENIDILNPEEALFLLETNSLILFHEDVELSLEICYSLLLNPASGCTLDQYRVFSHLSRLGYKLIRHKKSELVNKKVTRIPQSDDSVLIVNDTFPVDSSEKNDLNVERGVTNEPTSSGIGVPSKEKDNDVVLIEDSSSDSDDIEIIGVINASEARAIIHIEDDDSRDSDLVMLEAPGLVELPLKNWSFVHRRQFLSCPPNNNSSPIIIDALVSAQLERDILDDIPNIKGTRAWLFRPDEILVPKGIWPFHFKYLIDLNDERGDRGFRGRGGFRGRNYRARGWYLQRQVSQMKNYTFSLMTMVSQIMGGEYLQVITPPRALFQGPNYRNPRGNRSWGRISFNRRGTHFCPNIGNNFSGITDIVELSDDEETTSSKRPINNDFQREVDNIETKRLKLEPDIISSDSSSSFKTEPVAIKPELVGTAEGSGPNLTAPDVKVEIKSEDNITNSSGIDVVKKENNYDIIKNNGVNSIVLTESSSSGEGVNIIIKPLGEFDQSSSKIEPVVNEANDGLNENSVENNCSGNLGCDDQNSKEHSADNKPELNINSNNCEGGCNESPQCSTNVKNENITPSQSIVTDSVPSDGGEIEVYDSQNEYICKQSVNPASEEIKVGNVNTASEKKPSSICQEIEASNSMKMEVDSESTQLTSTYLGASSDCEKPVLGGTECKKVQVTVTDSHQEISSDCKTFENTVDVTLCSESKTINDDIKSNDTLEEVRIVSVKAKKHDLPYTHQGSTMECESLKIIMEQELCSPSQNVNENINKPFAAHQDKGIKSETGERHSLPDLHQATSTECNLHKKADDKSNPSHSAVSHEELVSKYEINDQNMEVTNGDKELSPENKKELKNIDIEKNINSVELVKVSEAESVDTEQCIDKSFPSSVCEKAVSSNTVFKKTKDSSETDSIIEEESEVTILDHKNDNFKEGDSDSIKSCNECLIVNKSVEDVESNSKISVQDTSKIDEVVILEDSQSMLVDLDIPDTGTIIIDNEDSNSRCRENTDSNSKSDTENLNSSQLSTNDSTQNRSSWKLFKENDKGQLQIQNPARDLTEPMEEDTNSNIDYGSHLLNEEHCTSLDNVLKRLQIFGQYQSKRELDESQQIKVTYDVYLPTSTYYRHSPDPDFRLVILGLEDRVPDAEQMMHLRGMYNDNKTFLFAVILRESIAYYLYDNVNLPVDNIPL